jgi:hypothetical protein
LAIFEDPPPGGFFGPGFGRFFRWGVEPSPLGFGFGGVFPRWFCTAWARSVIQLITPRFGGFAAL